MAELQALAKHACAACGAQAEWNPAKRRLVCPFCGTEAPWEVDSRGAPIRELDLAEALRELPPELRGWQTERRTVRCQSCRAVSVFDPERVGQNCDFCGSPALVDYEEINDPIRPQSLLPFVVSASEAGEAIRRWTRGRWLAPTALERLALLDTVRGIYLPYWTFDATVHCRWRAQAGHYVYRTETVRDASGRLRQRHRRDVRWIQASGVVEHVFDDELVPGTQGVDPSLLRAIEPFPTGELVPYDTAYLSGFVVEHYQVVLLDAARQAREAMERRLYRLCAARVPGDTYRGLVIEPQYQGRTFKHILVPVWLARYDYGRRSYQTLVNGATGAVAGRYPKSVWKILALILSALLLVAALASLV